MQDGTCWSCYFATCLSWYESHNPRQIPLRSLLRCFGDAGRFWVLDILLSSNCVLARFRGFRLSWSFNLDCSSFAAKDVINCGWKPQTTVCTCSGWPSSWCCWSGRSAQNHYWFSDPFNPCTFGSWRQSWTRNRKVKNNIFFLMTRVLMEFDLFCWHISGLCRYIPLSPILEGFVILKENPDYKEDN